MLRFTLVLVVNAGTGCTSDLGCDLHPKLLHQSPGRNLHRAAHFLQADFRRDPACIARDAVEKCN